MLLFERRRKNTFWPQLCSMEASARLDSMAESQWFFGYFVDFNRPNCTITQKKADLTILKSFLASAPQLKITAENPLTLLLHRLPVQPSAFLHALSGSAALSAEI